MLHTGDQSTYSNGNANTFFFFGSQDVLTGPQVQPTDLGLRLRSELSFGFWHLGAEDCVWESSQMQKYTCACVCVCWSTRKGYRRAVGQERERERQMDREERKRQMESKDTEWDIAQKHRNVCKCTQQKPPVSQSFFTQFLFALCILFTFQDSKKFAEKFLKKKKKKARAYFVPMRSWGNHNFQNGKSLNKNKQIQNPHWNPATSAAASDALHAARTCGEAERAARPQSYLKKAPCEKT